jgi:hypothetical protein
VVSAQSFELTWEPSSAWTCRRTDLLANSELQPTARHVAG